MGVEMFIEVLALFFFPPFSHFFICFFRYVSLFSSSFFSSVIFSCSRLDTKTFLHDNVNWTDSQLEKALEQRLPNYELMIKSWIEQRQYLSHAIRHIPLDSFFRRRLDSAMKASRAPLTPPDPFLEGYRRVEDVSSARIRARASKTDEWELGFDRITGGITYLRLSSMPSLDLASSSHLIGVFSYGSYSYSDFLTYLNDYGTFVVFPFFFYVLI